MGRTHIIELVEGDRLPDLPFEFAGEDITGMQIFLNIEREDGARFRKPAVVDEVGDPGNGVPAAFHFEWEPGDLVRGRHHAEVEVFDGALNETTRDRMILDVRRDFGP